MRAFWTVMFWLWTVWGIPSGAATVFLYLTSVRDWNTGIAYGVSLLALTPVLGGTVAAFMAEPVMDWSFWEAFFNFNGGFILLIISAMFGPAAKEAAIQKGKGRPAPMD